MVVGVRVGVGSLGEENTVSPSHEVEISFFRFILCLNIQHVRSRASLMSGEKLSPRQQQTRLNHCPAVCYTLILRCTRFTVGGWEKKLNQLVYSN